MKKVLPMTSRPSLRLIATVLICTWLPSAAAWGVPGAAPVGLFQLPLSQIPVPEPPNLFQFVKNKPAAIKLGKALFWDMQAGSDGVQACGSCHFSAGADNRLKNTLNPGTRGGDNTFQVRGPNDTLQPADFPFHKRQNPDFQASPLVPASPGVIPDANDVVGSQGVKFTNFVNIVPGSTVDNGTPISDTVFQSGGVNMRRVTARNTPSNINAIFNFNNFWDGRAHFIFNGVNPFGPLDTSAGVWFSDAAGNLTKQKIAIELASLASQATGPPLDSTEMSFQGRTFPQLGRKMLSLTPLGKQVVHPNDSELGTLSRAVVLNGKVTGQLGLNATYDQMIRDAFLDTFYKSSKLTPDGFTQMEANFSLFWGLAIQLYEATLVSGQTPFDNFLGGDQNALTAQQVTGMNLFFGVGKCNLCHAGTELTSATVSAAMFITNTDNLLIDRMPVISVQDTIYDNGYNSTGVRPMAEDIGRGGDSPFVNPLTGLFTPLGFCSQAELQVLGNLPFASIVLPQQLPANFPVSNGGGFKVPGLRNVELTAPYFHNGSVMTLEDVVDFYTRGGNFPSAAANPNLDFINITEIGKMQNAPANMAALVAFMKSLTDERVRNQSAPFDHPEIFVPNGETNGVEDFIRIPAKDANGVAASTIAVTLNPVISPTNLTSQTISGTNDAGSTVKISINNGPAIPATAVTATTWNATLTGLVEGPNIVSATATDVAGNPPNQATGTIFLDTTAPVLTINAVSTPTAVAAQTLSGTVEAGITPVISISSGATTGPVSISNGAWSTTITGLVGGTNNITVIAIDPAGNTAIKTAAVTYSIADGNFKGTGVVDISDALKAMRIATGLVPATPLDLLHGDVAPLVNGVPAPDHTINIADALMILRKVAGLVSF